MDVTGKNIDSVAGEKVSKIIESTLSELLRMDLVLALKKRLKEDYKVDLTDYEHLVQNPESFEMAVISIAGEGADLLLGVICQNLIKEFSINDPKSLAYKKAGDFVRLIYRIKDLYQAGI